VGTGIVTGIFVYPIKGCAPVSLTSVFCTPAGLENDRCWAIVDEHGKLLTQRDDPRLALIQPTEVLRRIDRKQVASNLDVSKWGENVVSRDAGDEPAKWLSAELGYRCRLVEVDDARGGRFLDCCPVSLVAEESIADLNTRLAEPVEMDCFRPSIVVRGMHPYEENSVEALSTGEMRFEPVRPVGRCVVVNVDQTTGIAHPAEPLRTLKEYRMIDGKVALGHYFASSGSGRVSVGAGVVW
jgi:uncharacterized protein